jgi:hypothetical protein
MARLPLLALVLLTTSLACPASWANNAKRRDAAPQTAVGGLGAALARSVGIRKSLEDRARDVEECANKVLREIPPPPEAFASLGSEFAWIVARMQAQRACSGDDPSAKTVVRCAKTVSAQAGFAQAAAEILSRSSRSAGAPEGSAPTYASRDLSAGALKYAALSFCSSSGDGGALTECAGDVQNLWGGAFSLRDSLTVCSEGGNVSLALTCMSQAIPSLAGYTLFLGMDSVGLAASACRGGNKPQNALDCLSTVFTGDAWDLGKAAADCRAGAMAPEAQRCRDQVRIKLGDVPGVEDALCGFGRL